MYLLLRSYLIPFIKAEISFFFLFLLFDPCCTYFHTIMLIQSSNHQSIHLEEASNNETTPLLSTQKGIKIFTF